MPSTGLAESAREKESEAIFILSPGKDGEEEKNQDRLMLTEPVDIENATCRFAIVCDGTTTSPYADKAAKYVSEQVQALFQEDGLRQTAEALKEMRQTLLQEPLEIDEQQSPLLRSLFEEIVRKKYQNSYQTTFVAVCLKREETNSAGMISIKALGCGDSALFIFRENGELCYNNVGLENELDRFKHTSPFTEVLPDCYDAQSKNILFDFKEFPEDVRLLLCSDGFYDSFANFKKMREWLYDRRAELINAELRDKCLSELHDSLNQKKGDDDISFIWLRPDKTQKDETTTGKTKDAYAKDNKEDSNRTCRRFFQKLFKSILWWSRLKIQKSLNYARFRLPKYK